MALSAGLPCHRIDTTEMVSMVLIPHTAVHRSEFERILFQYLSTIPMGELINVLHFCVTAMKIQRKWTENGEYLINF